MPACAALSGGCACAPELSPCRRCRALRREAFAAWLPLGGVPLSYAIAIGYVLVDTADKGVKAFQLAQQELGGNVGLHDEVDTPRCAQATTMRHCTAGA